MNRDYLYNNINVNNDFINNKDKVIIAGPCTFSSYEEVYSIGNSCLVVIGGDCPVPSGG